LSYVIGRIALSNFCIALCEPLDRFLQATGSPGLVGALSGMLKLYISDKPSIITLFGPHIETDVNEFLTCVDFVTYGLCRSYTFDRHGNEICVARQELETLASSPEIVELISVPAPPN
jgi:hypothetical protein